MSIVPWVPQSAWYLLVLKEAENPLPVASVAWNRLVMMLRGAMMGSGATEPQPIDSRSSVFWVWPDHTCRKREPVSEIVKWTVFYTVHIWKSCLATYHIACLRVPYYTVFPSISHSWSNSSVFDMHWPKPIRGPEFKLSKSCSTELYSEQSVSVPAPLNTNELHLSTPTWRALPATSPSGRGCPLR